MQYRKLGNTDIEASVVGFGAWAIGGWMWGGSDESDAIDALDAAIGSGVTLIDTAPMYGYGRSEEIVGRAIAGRRDKVVLATKCGLTWSKTEWEEGRGVLHFYGDEKGRTDAPVKYRVYKYLRPEAIMREVEESLARLRTDYIDLYQTHWQDDSTPIADTMDTLLRLKEQGKIRAIGVSNATPDQISEYEECGAVDVDQEKFNLLDRKIEQNGALDLCREKGISLLAYSPLANGLLTGKLQPNREFGDGDLRRENPRFSPENIERVNAMLFECQSLADAHNVSPGQLVIAWTAARYENMHVLCGARNAVQAVDNAKAGDVRLSADEVDAIDAIVKAADVA
jgi:methylglyoxal reductase